MVCWYAWGVRSCASARVASRSTMESGVRSSWLASAVNWRWRAKAASSLSSIRSNVAASSPRAVYKRVELCYTAGMKAYSQDLRQRVVRAVDAGQSQAEIAKTFAVSVATIKRYLKQRRETGHVQPKAIPGRPALIS